MFCPPDALKFNGPGPELINGRLAQWGFVSAALGEAQTGKLIVDQLQDSWPSVLAWSALIIYASLIPITKGAKRESFGEPWLPFLAAHQTPARRETVQTSAQLSSRSRHWHVKSSPCLASSVVTSRPGNTGAWSICSNL